MTESPATRPMQLVVESAGPEHGRRIDLVGDRVTVGRLRTCEVQLHDQQVSRAHAALWRRGGVDYVEDLGSSGGTFVNGRVVTGARGLRAGDTVAFAGVRLRYGGARDSRPVRVADSRQLARHDVEEQRTETISTVDRDQYNSYARQVVQQRESFFREIAATRTKARLLIWIGLAAFLLGVRIAAVLVVIGIGLHIVATARRKRGEQELPPLPPEYPGW